MRDFKTSQRFNVAGAALVLGLFAASASGATIGFEGFAPVGSSTNVSPTSPYTEAGFTLTPSTVESAVFDAAFSGAQFPGDITSWFGFAASNAITMTGPGVFDLTSLIIGPSNVGSGNIDATIAANVFGGGTLSTTFTGLTAATTETLNWANLTDVTFTVTSDAGLDDITTAAATPVPEPGSLLLFGLGLGAIALVRRRVRS